LIELIVKHGEPSGVEPQGGLDGFPAALLVPGAYSEPGHDPGFTAGILARPGQACRRKDCLRCGGKILYPAWLGSSRC